MIASIRLWVRVTSLALAFSTGYSLDQGDGIDPVVLALGVALASVAWAYDRLTEKHNAQLCAENEELRGDVERFRAHYCIQRRRTLDTQREARELRAEAQQWRELAGRRN